MNGTTLQLTLTPRDPLVARDGRPFGAGLRMKSLDWIYPSVLAGSLRTLLGNRAGGFDIHDRTRYDALVNELKALSIAGPFPHDRQQLYLPYPLDVEVCRNDHDGLEAHGIRPMDVGKFGAGAGCDLPPGLQPAVLSPGAKEGFKPERRPAFMRADLLATWLLNAQGSGFLASGSADWPAGFLNSPEKDVRTHVQMDYESGAGKTEGGLFQSVGLDVRRIPSPANSVPYGMNGSEMTLSVRVTASGAGCEWLRHLDELGPLGGERRLVRWQLAEGKSDAWKCPPKIQAWLEGKAGADRSRLRMLLATPAIFRDGWKPGWLNCTSTAAGQKEILGQIPGTDVVVRLVSACVDRWRPISGWGYEPVRDRDSDGKEKLRFGPKAVRRLTPAGSVYFFHVESGDLSRLLERWLDSVCDDEQDRRDGFGLAVWGSWQEHER